MRESEREPNFSLRSPVFRQSEFVESRVKVHLLDKGYSWILQRRGFTEDPREEILGNQIFWD